MDARRLATRLDAVQVLDVRERNEWDAGRIDGAVHVPCDELAGRVGELDRDRPVVTVCRSGERSGKAAEWLQGKGFDAENLDGGMEAWAEAGLPFPSAGGAPGTVAEPASSSGGETDDRAEEFRRLEASFLELIFAVQERFGDRQPSEAELRGFLHERLVAEGRTPEEAEAFLAQLPPGGLTTSDLV